MQCLWNVIVMLRFYREPEEVNELQAIDKDLLMKLRMPQVLVRLSILCT
jgi:hypothetical protein